MLSGNSVATVLYALATGFPDRAINVVAMSEEIDEDERTVLWTALASTDDRSEQARRFGDALRSLSAPRPLVNEAYRTAFYAGEGWKALSANPLFAYFLANRGGTPVDKWNHYFPIYVTHLARFRGTRVRVLEIDVYRGGGLEMLRHYLGDEADLVGIDVDESICAAIGDRYSIEIGDQEDPEFLVGVAQRHGPFDVVIDDGGHTMGQQITSVETLFPLLADGGLYMVEDCHTSYWPEYADDPDGMTFVAWAKTRLDDLHAFHHSAALDLVDPWQTSLAAVHAYDSVIILDKARRPAPFNEISGTSDYVHTSRVAGATNIELLATREEALRRAADAEARSSRLVADAEAMAAQVTASATESAEAARDELRILRAELIAANQQGARLRTDLDATREELDDANVKLHGSWGIIQEMRQSTSWRLTAPIRRAKSIIRRV